MSASYTPRYAVDFATGGLGHNTAKLLSEIEIVEGTLRDIKDKAAKGYFHDELNQASQASDVIRRLTKLSMIVEIRGALIGAGHAEDIETVH